MLGIQPGWRISLPSECIGKGPGMRRSRADATGAMRPTTTAAAGVPAPTTGRADARLKAPFANGSSLLRELSSAQAWRRSALVRDRGSTRVRAGADSDGQ